MSNHIHPYPTATVQAIALVNRPNLSGFMRTKEICYLVLFISGDLASESGLTDAGCGGMHSCGVHSLCVYCHRYFSCHSFSSVNQQNLTGCHSSGVFLLTHVKTFQIVSVCSYCSLFLWLLFSLQSLRCVILKEKVIFSLNQMGKGRKVWTHFMHITT